MLEGSTPPKPLHEILAGILTTRSDWSDPIVRNVIEYVNKTDHNKHLDFVCSITNNTFAIDSNIFIGQTTTESPQIRFCESGDSLVFCSLIFLSDYKILAQFPPLIIWHMRMQLIVGIIKRHKGELWLNNQILILF